MTDLETVASLPGVSAAVLGDLTGTFLGAVGTAEGETIAVEMAFVASTLLEIGEQLGLGALSTFSLAGKAKACLLVRRQGTVITALVAPPQSLGPVERAVDAAFQEPA
jgi:predicted regulator of Ras-like GTPase activity (Roadblock/LC7/MglB family)